MRAHGQLLTSISQVYYSCNDLIIKLIRLLYTGTIDYLLYLLLTNQWHTFNITSCNCSIGAYLNNNASHLNNNALDADNNNNNNASGDTAVVYGFNILYIYFISFFKDLKSSEFILILLEPEVTEVTITFK